MTDERSGARRLAAHRTASSLRGASRHGVTRADVRRPRTRDIHPFRSPTTCVPGVSGCFEPSGTSEVPVLGPVRLQASGRGQYRGTERRQFAQRRRSFDHPSRPRSWTSARAARLATTTGTALTGSPRSSGHVRKRTTQTANTIARHKGGSGVLRHSSRQVSNMDPRQCISWLCGGARAQYRPSTNSRWRIPQEG